MRLYRVSVALCVLTALSFFATTVKAADATLTSAWDAFAKNRTEEARKLFLEAEKNPATREEARLGLMYANIMDKDDPEVIKAFRKFAAAASDVAPYFGLFYSIGNREMTPDDADFLQALEENPKTSGAFKMYLNQRLGHYYQSHNSFSKANKYFEKNGAITQWNIVGEFDNISGGGFDNQYGPLEHPEATATFKNREGADVTWFNLYAARRSGWVDLESPFYASNTIMFVQTFCTSPTERLVQFRFGVSGSVKVWVNDKLIFSEREEQIKSSDSYILPILLMKGTNRILLQIGESEIDECEFLCRITDSAGTAYDDLEYSTTYAPYPKTYSFTPQPPVKPFDEAYFEALYRNDSMSFLNNSLMGLCYLLDDNRPAARRTLKRALSLFPDNTYLRYLMIRLYRNTGNRAGIRTLVEQIKTTDPHSPMGLVMAYEEAFEIEDFDKADSLNKRLEALYGETSHILFNKIKLLAAKKQTDRYLEAVDAGYRKFPSYYAIVERKVVAEQQARSNPREAISVLKDFSDEYYSRPMLERLMELYLQQGNLVQGLEILNRLIEENPDDLGYPSFLASIYFNIEQYGKAEDQLFHCIKIAPYVSNFYTRLGEVYQARDERAEAKNYYTKALTYASNGFHAREKLRELENKPNIFKQFTATDPYAAIRSAPSEKDYPNTNSIVVLDETQLVTYERASEQKHILAIKVLNSTGVDTWKEITIPYSDYTQKFTLEKAEVIKAGGEKITAENNDNEIVFTNLAPGDAIHFSYRLQTYRSGSLSQHFWYSKVFDNSIPSLNQKVSLLVRPKAQFKHIESGGLAQPVVTHKDEYDLYEWKVDKLNALPDERFSPEAVDIGMSLHISSAPDWDYISKWYSSVSKRKARSDYEVKELAAELFPAGAKLTPEQKIKTIYNYIVKNIRYSSVPFRQSGIIPQKASNVINTGIGDCKDVSTLFNALASECGLESQLVLVNTRDNGRKDMQLPSINFNHCISRVKLNNSWYYVELTSDELPLGTLGPWLRGAFVLPVTEPGTPTQQAFHLDNIAQEANDLIRATKIEYTDEGMKADSRCTRIGYSSAVFRNDYKGVTKEQREKTMLESLAYDYPRVQLVSFEIDTNLINSNDSLSYHTVYTVPDAVTEVDDMRLIRIPWSDPLSTFDILNAKERQHPVEMNYYFAAGRRYSERLEMTFPAGYSITVPEAVSMKSEFGSYEIKFEQRGNTLIGTRSFSITTETIPTEKFQSLKEFYNKVMKNDTKQYSLKPVAAATNQPSTTKSGKKQ